jgi:exonuclease III
MLRHLDADVIAFQEAWSADALSAVFGSSGLEDTHAIEFIREGSWDGVAVACAVRNPREILATKTHKAFPETMRLAKRKRSMASILAQPLMPMWKSTLTAILPLFPSHEDERIRVDFDEFSHSVLQVTVGYSKVRRPSVPPMEVFCAHLKSKLATPLDNEEHRDPAIKPHRAALGTALSTIRHVTEATALRIILNETMKENDLSVVLIWDLNDGEHYDQLAILLGQPSFRVMATSRAAKHDVDGLYSGVAMQKLRSLGDVYYTHEYRNVREVIDHILVSEQFHDWSERHLWAFMEKQFFNDHVPVKHCSASDHGIIRARFDWEPVVDATAWAAALTGT